jgi:adenine-specific DNA-methyltransferase
MKELPTIQFKGKPFVQNYHFGVKYHELVPDREKSLTDKVSLHDNLIIQGDNLKALKALLPSYAGKVKCMYIDVPYNTGNEGWIYSDRVNSPMIKEWLGKVVDKEDLSHHDKWLSMMMPRLKLLKELLSKTGIIFVSIDDHEYCHLKMMMDEIFGETQHIGTLIWKRRQNVDSRPKNGLSSDHEYVLCYGRTESARLRGKEKDMTKYANPDNDERGPWMSADMTGLATKEQRPNLHYDLENPETGIVYACPPTGWRYERSRMAELIRNGEVLFPKKEDGRPRRKKFSKDLESEYTGFSSILNTVFNTQGTRELRELFDGKEVFDFPKPKDLIKILIQQVCMEEKDIVLDSFAGSGTTAQAVLELNKEDGGNRKFILVEMEDYADSITAERLRRVMVGISHTKNKHLKEGLGSSFSYFTLGDTIEMEAILHGESLPSYEDLARYVFFTATGEQFDPTYIDEEHNFIGESKDYEVYLFYQPDMEYLKKTSLNLESANNLGEPNQKHRLVFAPMKFLDEEYLHNRKIKFSQLPFEIYRMKE